MLVCELASGGGKREEIPNVTFRHHWIVNQQLQTYVWIPTITTQGKHEDYTTSQFLLLMLAYTIFFKPYHAKSGISPGRTAYGSDNDEAKFSVSFPRVLSNSFPGERVMAWEGGSYVLWMLSTVLCISFSCWLHFFGIHVYCYWNYWPLLVNTTPLDANHFHSLLLLSVSCL